MRFIWKHLLQDKVTETPPAGEPQYDDLGYELPAGTPPPAVPPVAPVVPTEAAAPVVPPVAPVVPPTSVTGYSETPPVADPAPPVVVPPVAPVDLGFKLDMTGVPATDVNKISSFMKDNKFTEDQAKAYVSLKKEEFTQFESQRIASVQAQQQAINQTKLAWDKELREHSTFGGQNFKHNINQVEKFVDEFMPETKKVLTERKTVLPPHVMRDLLKAAERMYAAPALVTGAPHTPTNPEEDDDDPLEFYRQKKV